MSSKKSTSESGILILLSAPSGCGKTTIVDRLLKRHPEWKRSISVTTRPARTGEKDGEDYFFSLSKDFEKRKAKGKLLEYAHVYQYDYGTPKDFVLEQIGNGHNVLLTVDVQGAKKIMKRWDASKPFLSFFILPPSIRVLRERLESRKTEIPEEVEKRIEFAQDEIKSANLYHHTVINQNLDQTVLDIEKIILKFEEERRNKTDVLRRA